MESMRHTSWVLDLARGLPNTAQRSILTRGRLRMTHPDNPDPNAQPQSGQPAPTQYGQPAPAPQPGYGGPGPGDYGQSAPAGYPSAPPAGYGPPTSGRPGMVTAAAVLAFISGGLGLLGNLFAFGLIGSSGVPGFLIVLVILGLVLSAGLIYGGLQALQGKTFVILLALAGASILLNLISMIAYFQATSLISFIIPVLIVVFLLNPQSKAWILSRGGKTLG